MRPGFFTLRRLLLLLVAVATAGGLSYWLRAGMPLPGQGIPSTAGKIAFISTRSGHPNLWMMNGADGSDAVALTQEAAQDSEPAWAKNGSEIAFTSSGRTGQTSQIFYMDARPGARILPLTNTSSSKVAPFFGSERRIFYLAAGRLTATNPENKDSDLIFPEADMVRALYGDGENPGLLSTGGIVQAFGSEGATMGAVIKSEENQALVLLDTSQNAGALLGTGQRIFAHFLPGGKLLAIYVKGDSLPKMVGAFDEKTAKAGGVVPSIETVFARVGYSPPSHDGSSVVVYDLTATDPASESIKKIGTLAAQPDGFAVSPDGSLFALSFSKPISDGQGGEIGLLVLPTTAAQGEQPAPVYPGTASHPSFSADGKQLAFTSGKDIFVVPSTGGEAKNLTKGQGENSSPVWSPAREKEKTGEPAATIGDKK